MTARTAVLALVLGLAGGCRFTLGHLALATTRIPDPDAAAPPRHVTARSCVPIVLVFPAGRLPNLGRAIDTALAEGGGTTMRDVEVRYEIRYLPFVFGHACYVAEGDVS
jgi:hypothetical protein